MFGDDSFFLLLAVLRQRETEGKLKSSTHHESPVFRHVCFSQIRSSASQRSSVSGFPGFRSKEAVWNAVSIVEILSGFEEPHMPLSVDPTGPNVKST
jgi:hypothetical protein